MFKDRIVLITGGTSGIGLSLAKAFVRENARVIVCGRDAGRLRAARDALPEVVTISCDVTHVDQVEAMIADIEARHGRLDILVNNAGHLIERDFTQAPLDPAALAAEIEANLIAPIVVTNLALPLLRKAPGANIVVVGSGYGWTPSARAPVYSAAKAGLRAFVKALRMQLAPHGVGIMEVVPPAVDTPAIAHRRVKKVSPDLVAEETLKGLERRAREVFVGSAKALPVLLRLAPRFLEERVGRT
jgi:uncharacterized oxidoreductase